jgi:hypothetical protein
MFQIIVIVVLLVIVIQGVSYVYHAIFDSEQVKILKTISDASKIDLDSFKDALNGKGGRLTREEEAIRKKAEESKTKSPYIGYKIKNLECEYRGSKLDNTGDSVYCYPGIGDKVEGGTVALKVKISRENSKLIGSIYTSDKFKVWGTVSSVIYSLDNTRWNPTLRIGEAEVILDNGWVKTSKMSDPPNTVAKPKDAAPASAPVANPTQKSDTEAKRNALQFILNKKISLPEMSCSDANYQVYTRNEGRFYSNNGKIEKIIFDFPTRFFYRQLSSNSFEYNEMIVELRTADNGFEPYVLTKETNSILELTDSNIIFLKEKIKTLNYEVWKKGEHPDPYSTTTKVSALMICN